MKYVLPPELKHIIEPLWYSIEHSQQLKYINNCDMNEELHADYEKVMTLTSQHPSCVTIYLQALLADALLYLEEGNNQKARAMFLQIKDKISVPDKENVDLLISGYVNLVATYDRMFSPEEFHDAKENALFFMSSLVKENEDFFYAYVKGQLRLARILYDKALYRTAFEYAEESFQCMIHLKEKPFSDYINFAIEWLPLYKARNEFTEIDRICWGIMHISELSELDYHCYFLLICMLNEFACEYAKERKYMEANGIFYYLHRIYENDAKLKPCMISMKSMGKNEEIKDGKAIIEKGDKTYRKLQKRFPTQKQNQIGGKEYFK